METINTINENKKIDVQPLYVVKESEARLHLSSSNTKVGNIWSFSSLPGNSSHLLSLHSGTVLLTNVPGTCSKHCEVCFDHGCYAVNSARLHHNAVIRAWAENTLLLRNGSVFKMIDDFITKKNAKYKQTGDIKDIKVKLFRWNVSGEIESAEQLMQINTIAMHHPEVLFGIYTKNYEAVEEFFKAQDTQGLEHYRAGAPNFTINISQWHGCADQFLAIYRDRVNIFEYDDSNRKNNTLSQDDKERLKTATHCPAVTSSGHHAKKPDGTPITCDACKRCYTKTGRLTAVYAH